MNLRSRGPSNLVPRVENIQALKRENTRKRREDERQAHLDRLGLEMEHNQEQHQDEEPLMGAAHGGIGEGAANPRPQHPQRQARPIGTYDQPYIHGNRLGIRAPAVAANNFEIKSSLINMIENHKYNGLPLEDPFDHLDQFNKYCGLSKTNGISEDAL
ncbi:hypothetical protein N665_8480s0001, partial [Sinapis alba]